jgi:transposase, IS5 family
MLRIHLLLQWFTLLDPLMEEMLIDTPCFRRITGIEPMEGRIPVETTILNFRHLLQEYRIIKGTSKNQQANAIYPNLS